MSCAVLEKEESRIGKVGFLPHFGGCVVCTGIRTVAEENKWERGLEPTENRSKYSGVRTGI